MGARAGKVGVALLAAALGLHPIVTPDLWWHLASGRWIVEHGRVPREDVFSYTMTGHPWVNLQWLGDVAAFGLWRVGGPDLLVLGKAALLASVALALFAAARVAGAGGLAAGGAVALAVLAGAERTMARPEIVSYLGVAVVHLLALRARGGRGTRGLWAVPVLTALWINLHSLAFLAPVTLAVHAGAAALDPERSGGAGPKALLVAAGAATVALLANPWGPAAWTFPFTLLERIDPDADVFARILEFAPPIEAPGDPALRPFWGLVALTAASFAGVGPRRALSRLVVAVPFLGLALLARRNVPLFAIAAAPVLAANLADAARAHAVRIPGSLREGGTGRRLLHALPAAATLVAAFAVLSGALPVPAGVPRARGLGVAIGHFPEEATAALERSGVRGNLFHDLDFGGWLAWRAPDRPTFIDGRLEVAGADWLHRFVQAHESPGAWERMRSSWDLEVLLLQHSSKGSAAFLASLVGSGEWTRLHESPAAVLLAARTLVPAAPEDTAPDRADFEEVLGRRRGPEPGAGRALAFASRPLHEVLHPRPSPDAIRATVRLANLCLTLGRVDHARTGYEVVLATAPDDPEALFNLGLCDLRERGPAAAALRWREALPRVDAASREMFLRALEELGPAAE